MKSEASIFLIGGTVLYIHPGKGFGDLAKYLRKHDLISEEDTNATYRVAAGKKSIEQALVEADVVSDRKLWHLRYRYQYSMLKSLLRWKAGSLRFKRISLVRDTVVDNELFQHSSVPAMLWKMVSKGIQQDQVLPSLLDSEQGGFVFPQRSAELISSFEFPNNIAKLQSYEGQSVSLQSITSDIVDTSGDLLKALWLLCLLGVMRREKGSYVPIVIDEREPDPVKRSSASEKSPMQEEKTKKWISAVHRDYRRVMNKDYYSFLKLREEASLKDIEDRCTNRRKMLRHMRKNIPNLDEKTDQMIQELLDAIGLVWHHLGDVTRRREYDRKLQIGNAPLITSGGEDPFAEVLQLIDARQWHRALLELENHAETARRNALMAWVKFKLNMRNAERDLDKALELDSNNKEALQIMIKIALEQKNLVKANTFVDRLLQVEPSMLWAQDVKSKLERNN